MRTRYYIALAIILGIVASLLISRNFGLVVEAMLFSIIATILIGRNKLHYRWWEYTVAGAWLLLMFVFAANMPLNHLGTIVLLLLAGVAAPPIVFTACRWLASNNHHPANAPQP